MEIKNENEDGSENVEESISSDNSYDSKNYNILFNIDVKLSNNKIAKLYINENDDINEKIKYFCEAYKINPELEPKIKKIVESKLNQELSAYKNSSTASSSKQIINNKENNENREFLPVQDRLLEQIENESDTISEHENTQKNKLINNNDFIKTNNGFVNNKNKININNKNVKKEKNYKNNNLNLNTKKIQSNYNKQALNNTKNIISNKNNKENYKPKKINVIKMNNKKLIKKRPNSAKNYTNNKDSSKNRLYNNINNTPKKKLIFQQKYIEKNQNHKFSPEINNNSKKIYQKNYYLTNNPKVEDRLINYGNKLNQKKLNEKTNILLNNIHNNSFSPKIDNFSRYIAENTKSERINKLSAIGDYLTTTNKINSNKKNKIKLMNLKKPLEKRNLSQGNNIPKNLIKTFVSFGENNNIFNIENKSSLLTENKYYPEKNIFDCLYLESKLDKINKEKEIKKQFKDKYTFRPKISNLAKELKKENKETKKEFIERLSSLEKKDKRIKKENMNYKNDNNKNNFKPKITRGPKNSKQREIDENLKGYYDKRIIKQKEDLQNNEIINNKEKKKYYIQKSSEIIMKMKCEKYKLLFNKLDSDNDGKISYDKIKLTGINNDILLELSPVLRELNESKKNMDLKTFCIKVDKLFTDKNINNII